MRRNVPSKQGIAALNEEKRALDEGIATFAGQKDLSGGQIDGVT
ncbi:MAG TPA: hypothetical protein VF618_10330 [Thermoanaerobaculia bacterium]